jgi:outer membrane protein OmpA-like peptidoglycan-associated protein
MKTKGTQFISVPVRASSNEMRGNIFNLFVLLVLLILSGCATVKETVVLVPDADGKVGQVTVTTEGGSKTLTDPNTMVEVTGSGESPSDPKKIDQSQIAFLFADSIKALPLEPVSFLFYFMHDATEPTAESKARIPELLSLINKREFYEISIIGHTDTTGSDEYNMKLSSARAVAVRDILLSLGIPSARMELRYHGKRDPLVPTRDQVRELRNRRVEVVVK